jgi:1,4-alpha-glucan branching enzyme
MLMFVFSPYRNDSEFREVELVFNAPGALSVTVAGDFNSWDVRRNPMARGEEGSWKLKLHLQPGLYQYNFYIDDGHWAEDPGAPTLVSDGFGGRNALLFIEG